MLNLSSKVQTAASAKCRRIAPVRSPVQVHGASQTRMLRQKCAGIEDPEVRSRCEAERENQIQAAIAYIANADVSVGQNEDGFIAIYDEQSDQSSERRGSAAGSASNTGFTFTDENGSFLRTNRQGVIMGSSGRTRRHLLVTAHSHPQAFGPDNDRYSPDAGSQIADEANEYISENAGDSALVQFAPVIIKTPTGAIREFRSNGRCSGATGCQHRAGTPLPEDHYSH